MRVFVFNLVIFIILYKQFWLLVKTHENDVFVVIRDNRK